MPTPDPPDENRWGLIHVVKDGFSSENSSFMLANDESEKILFDESKRGFRVNKPLQVSINDKQELLIRFFSPRSIRKLVIWAQISGYDEPFRLAEFDELPPFIEFHQPLPVVSEDKYYTTRSGKEIKLMANPHISEADLTLEIACEDAYYKKITSVKPKWFIRFSDYGKTGSWQWPLLPAHAREGVAIALNMAYMFSSNEFVKELEKYRGKLHSDEKRTLVDVDQLYKKIMNHPGLRFGHVTGVGGLGGGETLGIHDGSWLQHYPDDQYEVMALFHEYGHCLGYGHSGNMTNESTGNGFRILLRDVYKQMCVDKKLPIYSRRFMHNRRYGKFYGVNRYVASTVIIEDPELDALDGGLVPSFVEDSEEPDTRTPLSCSISSSDIPGATPKTFVPKDICTDADRIYIVNNASGHFSIEMLKEEKGVLKHMASLQKWTYQGEEQTFAGEPNGITVAHGKLYVTNTGSRTDVFDASDLHFITTIGNGKWGEGEVQTVHAFDPLISNGFVFIRDKRRVCVFMEADVTEENYQHVSNYCRFANLGEAMGTYGLAINSKGILYATHQGRKALYTFRMREMREKRSLVSSDTLLLPAPIFDVALADERMFVSLNQKARLVEINPSTGTVIKDYTNVSGSSLRYAEKISVSRQTLFVTEPKNGTVTGIPLSNLN